MQFEIKNVSVLYPQTGAVLNNINLNIQKGDFIGIVGKAGSGKTTLIETIGGLHKPQSGAIYFESNDIYGNNFDQQNFRRKLQVVFQFPENQFFESSIYDEIAFGMKMLNFTSDEIERKTFDILKKLFPNESSSRALSPFALSGGQKKKLAVACALSIEPEVILLDEPFSGLDQDNKNNLAQILREENSKGTTILLVSHDPDILCEIAEKIIVLSEGNIVKIGTPAEVYNTQNKNTYGIGMPNTKEIADMIDLDLSDNLSYDAFISKLIEKYR